MFRTRLELASCCLLAHPYLVGPEAPVREGGLVATRKNRSWKLDEKMVQQIVELGKAGNKIKEIFAAFPGARNDVVRSVLSANGLATSKDEVRAKDAAKVERLMGQDVTHHPRQSKAEPTVDLVEEAVTIPDDEPISPAEEDAVAEAIAANKAEVKKTSRPRKARAPKAAEAATK